jgi:hypothetical protein
MSSVAATTSNLKEIALAAKANAAAAAPPKAPKFTEEEIAQRNERQLRLLTTFADKLVEVTNERAAAAAEKGYGWTKVAEFFLPGLDKVEDNGEVVAVPRNPPEQTHWAGPDADPSNGGVPIVMLLQGVRENTKQGPRLRPDLLAGGKTALELAQAKVSARLDCSFNSKNKSLIVSAIWIEEDWQRFQDKRREQREQRQHRGPRHFTPRH